MENDRIKGVEKRREKINHSEEWENFTTIIDDIRWYFNPDNATLRRQVEKGAKLNKRRVNGAGALMLNDYASGVLSESITSGESWFEYKDRRKVPEDVKMFDDISKITYDRINVSNFNSEMHRDQKSAACDGTALMYVEYRRGRLNYIHVPYGSFWFVQNFEGRPDIVWVEQTTTAGALVGEFGINEVSDKCREKYEGDPDKEVKIIHYCAPRMNRDADRIDDLNKPYELITYEKDTSHQLRESGTDMQKFIVYRVKRAGNEVLGRGPAFDAICDMYGVERCSKDLQRGLRMGVMPVWAVAASMGTNGFKWINQENGSVMVYNDTGIAAPPQPINPPVHVEFGQKYLEWMITQMRGFFFLDYFNPLENRRNMTLGEAKERVTKAQQMVDQIVGPLREERLDPLLQWTMVLLGEAGEFLEYGSWQEIQEKMQGRIKIRYKSRLANVQRKIRLMSIAEYAEMTTMVGQVIPDPTMQYEFMVQTDWGAMPDEIREGTNAPDILKRNPEEVKALVKQFQKAMAAQAQTENAVKMADAASKGGTAPEAGSPTSMLLGAG